LGSASSSFDGKVGAKMRNRARTFLFPPFRGARKRRPPFVDHPFEIRFLSYGGKASRVPCTRQPRRPTPPTLAGLPPSPSPAPSWSIISLPFSKETIRRNRFPFEPCILSRQGHLLPPLPLRQQYQPFHSFLFLSIIYIFPLL